MFSFIKNTLSKIYSHVTSKLASFFTKHSIDESTLKELELVLIGADAGVKTTRSLINTLRAQMVEGKIKNGAELRAALEQLLVEILLRSTPAETTVARIQILVGVNGSGKTTTLSKLAHHYQAQGQRVLLAAADTFRAAAVAQLEAWAHKTGTDIVIGKDGQDPASVVYAAVERFKQGAHDILLIDTAGRLQNKTNLMQELAKIRRVIGQLALHERVETILTVDAMLGQNSLEQAKLFKECVSLDGIILTKMDGTGKGGIVFAICQEAGIPIMYFTFGEQMEQIKRFEAREYVHDLLYS